MTGPVYLFCWAIPLALIWLTISVWEWRQSMSARRSGVSLPELTRRKGRCLVTRSDAAWLSAALHDLDCPACSAPLARHR